EGLAHTIGRMNHTAVTAASGREGLARFKERRDIGFVITDLKMEGMDGVQVLREIQALDPDVPTMIITAYGSVETAVEAMKLGAFDFLTKPFAPEVVRLKVERALELGEARRGKRKLEALSEYLQAEAEGPVRFDDLIGGSEQMLGVFRTV